MAGVEAVRKEVRDQLAVRSVKRSIGWYEYRGARFKVTRFGRSYYVAEIKMPWHRGSLVSLQHDAGWFGLTANLVIRKVKRTINREIKQRWRNGERIDERAWEDERPAWLRSIPETTREYTMLV